MHGLSTRDIDFGRTCRWTRFLGSHIPLIGATSPHLVKGAVGQVAARGGMSKEKKEKRDKEHRRDKSDKSDKEKRRREKEEQKAHETEEEKRARRLAKKMRKHGPCDPESIAGYTNEANPWNDSNLTEQFVWGKKVDKDLSLGKEDTSSMEAQRRRRAEMQVEIERVKQAREDRERERLAVEEERRLLEREREQMAFVDNEKREDAFQLQQTYLRANIRVHEGRAKAIDNVAQSLELLSGQVVPEDALEMQLQDPLAIFRQLTERELQELLTDVRAHADLDTANGAFWEAMTKLTKHGLSELAAEQAGGGVHAEVNADVAAMFEGKDLDALDELQEQIMEQMRDADVDTDYWQNVLAELQLAWRGAGWPTCTRRYRPSGCGS